MTQTVLVVDDSLTVRMDLCEAFDAAGFRAVPCATLAEARAALAAEPPDVVVLDLQLPDGDGLDLLRELRAGNWIGPVVLVLSTEADVADRARGLSTGADEYVGKPYDGAYVVARTAELLRERRPPPAAVRSTVLVVDDSATFREALVESLAAAGYEVGAAASGEDGLRAAAVRRPDAIVVDGVLPGIDGPSFIRRIRLDASLRSVPCLLLTASGGPDAELKALEAGADAFVRKEDGTGVVLARLAAMLRGAGGGGLPVARSVFGPKRILAVDDSATYLDAISEALRAKGFDVVPARSGEEALELLAVQPVDCILLDLMMPGIGGEATCRRIKAAPALAAIPLLLLTGREDHEAMIAGLAAGADDYVAKSADLAVLEARIVAQLRRRQMEDEHRGVREELLRREMVAAEARAAHELAATRAALVDELERKNRELESFSYSVSHDLKAPLRAIEGFSRLLEQHCGPQLDERGREHLARVRAAAKRMDELIGDLLELSRVGRAPLRRRRVDLSAMARQILAELARAEPERAVVLVVAPELFAEGDPGLLRNVMENLLRNAWKFTAKTAGARIEVTSEPAGGATACVVRDNGAGFDMEYAAKLFRPFQRLHREEDFPGTGIGLATVARIIDRHGGRVWAEGAVGAGATIRFTLSGGAAAAAPAPADAAVEA